MEKVKIDLQDISKSYYSETTVTQALRKISLSFRESEFVAITGESGSGKSTLLNIIGGMDTFDDGEMFVDGQPTFQYDEQDWEEYRRNKIGYVFQDYSLVGHYTALTNVMSALLIMEYEQKQAEEIAKRYLKQVGLEGFETHKASELSSGQKQRLSIARALAKDTGIIVADEPTGNLDSETGDQIIRLLKELSKNRLVIMVTHNYDQAEAYVTRKVRLHDGNIVSDVQVNQGKAEGEEKKGTEDANVVQMQDSGLEMSEGKVFEKEHLEAENVIQENNPSEGEEKSRWKDLWKQSQIASYFAMMNRRTQRGRAVLFTAFLFIIGVVSFIFIGQLFMHGDDTLTKKYSTSVFYHQDQRRLVVKRGDGKDISEQDVKKLYSVRHVEMVDSCDYANDINFYFEKNRDYKIRYGTQDSAKGEEKSTIGFLNDEHFMMSVDCISEKDLAKGRLPKAYNEVVLYSKDESILDSQQICYFASHNIWGPYDFHEQNLKIVGLLKEKTEQIYFTKQMCQMYSLEMYHGKYCMPYEWVEEWQDYRLKPEFIPVINSELEGDQVRISYNYGGSMNAVVPLGTTLLRFQQYDENGEPVGEAKEQTVDVLQERHKSSKALMEVSEEFFYTFFPEDKKCPQASVYLTSYAKVDSVIKKLERMGYEAQSTYRVSVMEYIQELVDERLVIIGISAFGLAAILLAQILILRSLMKIRVKDYFVMKFIGMRMQMIRKISYFEIGAYSVAAMLLTVIVMWILRFMGIKVLQEMLFYYSFGVYLVFVVYNLVVSALTVASFNHLLKGRLNQ